MGSWKKILVEGDAVASNLATANLTQPSNTTRSYSLNGDVNRLAFKGGIIQFSNTSNTVSYQFDNPNGIFDARSANGIRLSDGDNAQYIDLKPKSEVSASYTITLPNAAPGSANRILEANATGDLSWIATPSGGGVTINNNADNSLITGSGTANTLEGEANLTYDGTNLAVASGGIQVDNNESLFAKNTGGSPRVLAKADANNVAVFNGGFTQTLIGGLSGIELNGPVTANEFIQEHSSGISSDGDYGAGADITFLGSSGTSVVAGKIYYYNGTTWTLYSTAVAASQISLLGMAAGSTMSSGFILKGFVRPSLVAQLTAGRTVFSSSSNASGQVTSTAPTAGYQRILGHAVSTSVIYFNPSAEYIDLT